MVISQENLDNVIRDISYVSKTDVFISDKNGIILASTKFGLASTFNEAAKEVVSKNLEKLVVYDEYTYEGAFKGVNVPIFLNGEVYAIIGILGPPLEVISYCEVVKKMAEILLFKNFFNAEKTHDEVVVEDFVIDWIFSKSKEGIEERGERLGIDINKKWRIAVIESHNITEDLIILDKIGNTIESEVKGLEKICVRVNSYLIVLFSNITHKKILETVNNIRLICFKKHEVSILVGVDEKAEELINCYKKAKFALNKASLHSPLISYKDLHLEIFTHEISEKTKREFIDKIFKNHSRQEIEKTLKFLLPYFKAEGSITQMAEDTGVHKNTIRYRLKSIFEKTGVDPQTITGASLFQIAYIFYNSIS